MTQKARPAADISTSGWSPTPVYDEIDEAIPNDALYVEAGTSAAVFTVKLARLAAPVAGPDESSHALTVRIDGPSPVLVELLQGTTLIASRVCDAPDGFDDYTLTLTRAEAARIEYEPGPNGDPDLRVRVSAVSALIAPNQSLPQTIPASGSVPSTYTVSGLPTDAVPSQFVIALSHGGPIGPLTLTLTDPNSTTINLIQQLPNTTGTCTATGFLVFLSDAGASGIQGVNQANGTITGIYQPAQPFSGFTGDPNGTWTATLTNAGANTGSITSLRLCFGTPATPLVVVPTATPSSGSSPLGVSLGAAVTGGTAALVKIDWDDGSPVAWVAPASLPVTHTYAAGEYEPTVTAYTVSGGASSGSAPVTVSPTTTTYTVTGSHTWTAPAGVTSVIVECWGGGGAGAGGGGGGGGGGAYSKATVSVTPGNNYTVVVGLGGPAPGGSGLDSTFNTTSVVAKAGTGATAGTGGTGGAAASGTGTVKYSGGTGANASGSDGGGGGSSAGTAAGGNGASGATGGSAPTGGGAGGNGGTAGGNGAAGSAPGGGGGGCSSAGIAAGAGAAGQVKLTW